MKLKNIESVDRERISKMLSILSPREQEVLKMRFGLEGKDSMTLKEVALLFNVSIERIRQIETKAFRRLRHPKVQRLTENDRKRVCLKPN
jgi:RNA polymerase primary sigma factor